MKWHWHIPLLLSDAVVVLSNDMKRYYLSALGAFSEAELRKRLRQFTARFLLMKLTIG